MGSHRYEQDPACLSSRGAVGVTPAHCAAKAGKIDVMKFIIETNENLMNIRDKYVHVHPRDPGFMAHPLDMCFLIKVDNRNGNSLAHHAASHGRSDALHLLASKMKSMLVEQNNFGDTPAHLAASSGQLSCLEVLVHYDPRSVNIEDRRGYLPVDLSYNDPGCRTFLRELSNQQLGVDFTLHEKEKECL